MSSDLNIFSVATEGYEPFVLPHIIACQVFNPGVLVEVVLRDPERFQRENRTALEIISQQFGDCWHFQDWGADELRGDTKRFVTNPEKLRKYVFIVDIDVLTLEDVSASRIEHMHKTGLPYCNILRPAGERMSGLHFTLADAYYPVLPLEELKVRRGLEWDENTLYDMVVAKGLPLPEMSDRYRPVHGYHLSLNRPPLPGVTKATWTELENLAFLKNFDALTDHACWKSAFPLFDVRYKWLLAMLESVLCCMYHESNGRLYKHSLRPSQWWDNMHAAK